MKERGSGLERVKRRESEWQSGRERVTAKLERERGKRERKE